MAKKVFIANYGCTANYNHGEIIAGMLVNEGFKLVKSMDNSDYIILNTCIVKSVTENKIKSRVKLISRLYPNKKIIITGCAADAQLETYKKINSRIIFVSSHHIEDIIKAIKNEENYIGIRKESKLLKKKLGNNKAVNIVEISQGCLGNCSFCITKTARGKLISYPVDDIISEIENSVHNGIKEIWLTSQDCGCYGMDIGTDIIHLLKKINDIEGDFKTRLGMSNPQFIKNFSGKLAKELSGDKMFKFIHIPVQSGSDKILNLMKRGHNSEDFRKIVSELRSKIPDITISTDIIIGFPGETEKDFQDSIKLIRETKPDIVNISKFGARPGTEAKEMKQINSKTIKERTVRFASFVEETVKEKNKKFIGKVYEILIDEKGRNEGQWVGRNINYKPVLINSDKKDLIGNKVKVKITSYKRTHLVGKIITG